jgi:CRP-like cAMP-binding protein
MVGVLTFRLQANPRASGEDLVAVQAVARRSQREVAPRRDLLREGDEPRSVFLVLEGWAGRYKALPDGRRQIVAFLLPGDLFDYNGHLLRQMDHSVSAITRLRVAEIGRDELDCLLARPGLAEAFRRSDLLAASIQREWTLNVGQRSALERIAHLLCETYLRLETVGLARSDRCDFPLTQVDLADATGLTPVHVNRTLQELRRQKLVELSNKKLQVPNMALLRKAALFNDNYLHLDRAGTEQGASAA